jgi:hypothetical protein
MNKITVIIILVILSYLFIKIHQQYDDRSTMGICSMIVVYILSFEISSLLFSDMPKFID